MSFIQNTLSENEKVDYIKINKWTFLFYYFLEAIGLTLITTSFIYFTVKGIDPIFISIMTIGLIIFFYNFYQLLKLKNIEMAVTDNRVIFKSGIISIKNEEIQNQAIETVEVNQGIIERIFGYGDVKITGRGNAVVIFKGVDDPINVKKRIHEKIENS